jgi:adenine specific DNA methylase Mod
MSGKIGIFHLNKFVKQEKDMMSLVDITWINPKNINDPIKDIMCGVNSAENCNLLTLYCKVKCNKTKIIYHKKNKKVIYDFIITMDLFS